MTRRGLGLQDHGGHGWRVVKERGPWPFVTLRHFEHVAGGRHLWASRPHRKDLGKHANGPRIEHLWRSVARWAWRPWRLNWWIGSVFALGASLFAIGAVLSLWPAAAAGLGLSIDAANWIFFAGSIPFTTAAYLQLFQAANMPEAQTPGAGRPARVRILGWQPGHLGWLSCALQFPGTVLFNFNTFDGTLSGLPWWAVEFVVWGPNAAGSVLFLLSGWLAWIEVCHAHWAWRPGRLSWWVAFANLLGCVGFGLAATFAFVLPDSGMAWSATLANVFTLLGACGFFVGSLLMLPEDTEGGA